MENNNGEEDHPKRSSEMTSSSSVSNSNEPADTNPDLALAMSLQEQWSDDDDDPQTDEEEELEEDEEFDYEEYSTSQDVDDEELGFLEEEDGESEMTEDEMDPDEMSYEELMELGETIGDAEQRGLSADTISLCLCPITYPTGNKDQCVVCQAEYEEGETVVGLSCKHVYHAECITQWLRVKKTCPICTMEISPPPPSTVEDVGKTKKI